MFRRRHMHSSECCHYVLTRSQETGLIFVALFVLSLCPFDISVGVGAFVIGLGQISSFLSLYFILALQRWAEFVRECDPDIITGYNIQNFDFPYVINRANHLKVKDFTFLGRIKDSRSVIKESMIQSKQMGKRENKIINIEGRVQFDLLQVGVNLHCVCYTCFH